MRIPKCPCVTWGCQRWKKEPWKHGIRATAFYGENYDARPSPLLLDTGVEFAAPTFGSIMNALAKFPESFFRFFAPSKTTTFQCWKVWKGCTSGPDARISSHSLCDDGFRLLILKANLNQANLSMLSAKQKRQIFIGSWLGIPFPGVKCQAATCIYLVVAYWRPRHAEWDSN